jgi:hypothetical protein
VANGEPLEAGSVQPSIHDAGVVELALHLQDQWQALGEEVDPADPRDVVAEVDLTAERREARSPEDLGDP